jgi:TetR/AcrR family transcriptional regulator
MTPPNQTETQADRSAETRSRILDAALTEFAASGLAGARTESIAAAAGVNKALLYYYFESKEKLYAAALEMVSARVRPLDGGVSSRCQPRRTAAARGAGAF